VLNQLDTIDTCKFTIHPSQLRFADCRETF